MGAPSSSWSSRAGTAGMAMSSYGRGARPAGRPGSADDDDRAVGVGEDLEAGGPRDQLAQPAVPTSADDDEVGRPGRLDQREPTLAPGHDRHDLDRGGRAVERGRDRLLQVAVDRRRLGFGLDRG